MKKLKILSTLFCILFSLTVMPQELEKEIIPIYTGSEIRYDDKIGFEELSFIVGESKLQTSEGVLRRLFCRAPEGRSPFEVVKNYEKSIADMGGTIIFFSRNPKDIEIEKLKFQNIFAKNRKDRGLSTYHYTHTTFPAEITEYLVGKIKLADKDVYTIIAVGHGAWAANEHNRTFYEFITLEVEPMEMDMISAADIGKALSTQGRIAIYSIYFDIGESEVKAESTKALEEIAEYLNSNKAQKVIVVGHTDNTGDFDSNIKLSNERAEAVIEKLITQYNVDKMQLKPYGVGSVSPITSNSTENGRAKNRRVEIVEQ